MSETVWLHDIRAQVATWLPKSRALLNELLEDATSDLQREMIVRSISVGHSPAEIHAFADELRSLSDRQIFEMCTLAVRRPPEATVEQLVRIEADPLTAFEMNGGKIEPNEDDELLARVAEPIDRQLSRQIQMSRTFFADARATVGVVPASSELASRSHELLADLLGNATRALGITWAEYDVVGIGAASVQALLDRSAEALNAAMPVVAVLGSTQHVHRRFVLILQVQQSSKTRAWQLYEPLSREVRWLNEGDLTSEAELPFSDPGCHMVTRIILPSPT